MLVQQYQELEMAPFHALMMIIWVHYARLGVILASLWLGFPQFHVFKAVGRILFPVVNVSCSHAWL